MFRVSLIYIDVNRKRMTGRNMTVHHKGRIEKMESAVENIVLRATLGASGAGSVLPPSVCVCVEGF